MKKRSLLFMIFMTIITFGIYLIYWTCSFQGQLKEKTGEGFGPVGHFFMLLFTFGIYGLYWQFVAGKRLARLGTSDLSILYLVLALFGIGGLVNPLVMQSQANDL